MPKYELLKAKLQEWKDSKQIVAFCPWEDRGAMLCGYVADVDESTVTFDEIGTCGQPDGQDVCRYKTLTYVYELKEYGDRLKNLKDFKPTLPDEIIWVAKRSEVRRMVTEASRTQEIVDVTFKEDHSRVSVKVLAFDGKWMHLHIFNESISSSHEDIQRISAIHSIAWRNRSTEADEYLLNLQVL